MNRKRKEIICRCNSVSRDVIEDAIRNQGCKTLNDIFDATQAGVGPCGGSCRRKLGPLLKHYLETGRFPEKITEDRTGKFGDPPGSVPPATSSGEGDEDNEGST